MKSICSDILKYILNFTYFEDKVSFSLSSKKYYFATDTITEIPKEYIGSCFIQNCTNLTSLNLSYNRIVCNRDLNKLTKLKTLNLWSNSMITNDGIKHLTNLNKLIINYNTKITDEGIKNMVKLKELSLGFDNLITNNCLISLTNLISLHLVRNNSITFSVRNLTILSYLNLDRNHSIYDVAYTISLI